MLMMTAYLSDLDSPPPRNSMLPRLMYIGDQPVEATVAGPAQLHKLLEDYPADRLTIVESNIAVSRPDRRLPHVAYASVFAGVPRLQSTRYRALHCSLMFMTSRARWRLYARMVRDFAPDAILTISHGSSWVTAAEIARRFELPLHLVLHDDAADMSGVEPWLRQRVYDRLGSVYRQATSRMCIGPMMEAFYREQYGVPGVVMYPTRSAAVESLRPVRPRGDRPLVFAYSGSIHHIGENGDLAVIAKVLESMGHLLLVHSPSCTGAGAPPGLDLPNVIARPPIPGDDWLDQLRREADVLVLTMNFNQPRAAHLSFPSKLADYTATGLPVLLRAPPYSSAARWAKENAAAELVDTPDMGTLRAAIARLEDASARQALGEAAAVAGDACFSRAAVVGTFHQGLLLKRC